MDLFAKYLLNSPQPTIHEQTWRLLCYRICKKIQITSLCAHFSKFRLDVTKYGLPFIACGGPAFFLGNDVTANGYFRQRELGLKCNPHGLLSTEYSVQVLRTLRERYTYTTTASCKSLHMSSLIAFRFPYDPTPTASGRFLLPGAHKDCFQNLPQDT